MQPVMNITDPGFSLAGLLPLAENEIQLWRIDLAAVAAEEARWQRVLSNDERARSARFHFSRDRQRYVAARAVLRIILAAYLGSEPEQLAFRYSDKDKPALDVSHADHSHANRSHPEHAIEFNVSHSGTVALLAFSRERPVGVDVEQVRNDFDVDRIARRFFSEHEQQELSVINTTEKHAAFFRCWTRKEAYIKATGAGLSLPLSQFDVSIRPGDEDALISTRPDPGEAGRWSLREVPAGPGYVAALCVQGRGWKLLKWSS
jgi:4'-phosphopantetheinyl transferase